ncbi:MAG: oligosaccharide flippase family protein [Methylococcaceae bacterium]|jgi:O-antigen/teichoic acid export membrane protein
MTQYGHERVKRGIINFLVGKGVSAVSGFFAMLLVVHGLSIADFAAYSVVVALVEVFNAITGFGFTHIILRYVPELYANSRFHTLRATLSFLFGVRTIILIVALGTVWFFSHRVSAWIGLEHFIPEFQAFLVVVGFRSSNQFLTQILESTLHQGVVQSANSLVNIGRCIGMVWLGSEASVNLLNVVWLEAFCEVLSTIVMLAGIFSVIWLNRSNPDDTHSHWYQSNRQQLIRFATFAYLQHLATLPFGGTINRLVGGAMLGEQAMATFGFAQSLYEYVKRYLPTQLLIGLIRPVIVARYTTTGSFSSVAKLCEQFYQVNFALLAGLLAIFWVDGESIMTVISAGKYAESGTSAMILCALLMFIVFETQRLVLELLAQMVEHYEVMVLSNLILSFSVFGGIAAIPWLGAIAFPLANSLAIFLTNIWVMFQLSSLGYPYQHDWRATFYTLLIFLLTIAVGKLCQYAGYDWIVTLPITMVWFILLFLRLKWEPSLGLIKDLIGKKLNQE